ncbi:MAG: PepSY-associated TM helix domain-containing protein, partial [Ferruginibacter sp.]
MKKNFIVKLHSMAGLVAGIFILGMSISGAVLVFHDNLDAMQQPALRSSPAKNITIDSAYRAIQHHYPHAQISNVVLPENSSSPFLFFIYDSSYKTGKAAMQVFLHPQTAAVLKASGSNNYISWLSKFHNSFHLGKTGEWLLGFFSLIFLLSIITGFILYRKNILAVLLFKKTVYKRINLHHLIGVYALLFNLMIAISGFWMQRYVFKTAFYQSYDYTPVLKASP